MLDFTGKNVADPAQARMSKFVFIHILHDGSSVLRVNVGGELCPLSHDHNTEITAAGVAQPNLLRNFLNVERKLGNQDYVRTASHAAVDGNPSRVAPHDFDDHHAIVGLGSSVDAVNSFGHYVDGGVEAEAVISAGKVVSMVLGTPMTFTARSCNFAATDNVSSPPIAISASTLWCESVEIILSIPSGLFKGLVREVRRIVPPRGRMPATFERSSGMALSSRRPRQPSRNPMNSSS